MLDQFHIFSKKPLVSWFGFESHYLSERRIAEGPDQKKSMRPFICPGSPNTQRSTSSHCISLASFCLKSSRSDWPSALLQALESKQLIIYSFTFQIFFPFPSQSMTPLRNE